MNSEVSETTFTDFPASSKEQQQTRECEYFHMVIRPMLSAGHEGELCEWLKQMGLLRRALKCTNTNCTGGKMEWSKARVVDKYNWSCSACTKKVSIRDGSFFMQVKCELKVVMQAILGWCERAPVDITANNLRHVSKVSSSIIKFTTAGTVRVLVDASGGGFRNFWTRLEIPLGDILVQKFLNPPPEASTRTCERCRQ